MIDFNSVRILFKFSKVKKKLKAKKIEIQKFLFYSVLVFKFLSLFIVFLKYLN